MLKKILVHTKRSIKFIVLFGISLLLISGIVVLLYKQTYAVYLNGEQLGYTENKSELQRKINEYIDKGEEENVAFVQVASLPEYKICLLKKDIVPNDDEIFNKIKETGKVYYRYYAIAVNDEEKAYVSKFENAENIVNELKEKNSINIDNISIIEKYETESKEFSEVDTVVADLYEEPKVQITTASGKKTKDGTVNTGASFGSGKIDIGISFIRPVSGPVTARFGVVSRIRSSAHTGLDISAPTGTPIKAAASGTVALAKYNGAYGNMVVVSHGNGVQTYYCHSSKMYVSEGEYVEQGEVIAAVGSTGNSTGPHAHIEVRVNGVAYNPENYL